MTYILEELNLYSKHTLGIIERVYVRLNPDDSQKTIYRLLEEHHNFLKDLIVVNTISYLIFFLTSTRQIKILQILGKVHKKIFKCKMH